MSGEVLVAPPRGGLCERDHTSPHKKVADPDRLDVEIFFQVLLAGLAAIAAHLVAAERYRRVHRLIAIHPDRARAKRLGDAMGFADVLGPNPAAQSERRRGGALGGDVSFSWRRHGRKSGYPAGTD